MLGSRFLKSYKRTALPDAGGQLTTGSAVPVLGGLTEPAPRSLRAHAGPGAALAQVWGV